jgi:hypothetical protein
LYVDHKQFLRLHASSLRKAQELHAFAETKLVVTCFCDCR